MSKLLFNKIFFGILGVIVSISAISFHYFIFINADGSSFNYMSLYPAKSTYVSYDESIMYWPKVTSMLNGNALNSADPYIKEYTNIKTHVPFISEFLVAKIIEIIDLSINSSVIIIDIISITFLFVLIYAFLLFISNKPSTSCILSLIFIFSFDLILATSSLPFISKLKFFFLEGNISILMRTPNMSISILPLVLFSYFFYLENFKNNISKFTLNGMFISSALLVYFNVYMWTYTTVIIFSNFLVKLFYDHKTLNNKNIKIYIVAIFFYVLILIPFLLLVFIAYNQEGYQDYLVRFGLAETRSIHVSSIIYLTLIIMTYFINKKYNSIFFKILIGFLVALIIVKNIQLILGYTVQTFHWSRDAAIPLLLLITIYQLSQFNINKKIIGVVFIIFYCLFHISAYTYSSSNWNYHVADNKEIELYKYIEENTHESAVIASPWELSSTILNYSNRNVYIPHAPVTFAKGEEIIKRLLDYYCAIGVDIDYFSKILDDKHSYYSIFHMNDVYHPATFSYFLSNKSLNLRKPFFSKGEKRKMIDLLSTCIIDANSGNFQMKFDVDYLITSDKNNNITTFLYKFPFVKIDGYHIFKFNNKIADKKLN